MAEITELPYEDSFFDIGQLIGVLEYCSFDYCQQALQEMSRVLKSNARFIVDIPNLLHPLCQTMFKLEEYMDRPNIPKERSEFEDILVPFFSIDRVDDSQVMIKYFVENRK